MDAARPIKFPLTNPTSNAVETDDVTLSATSFVWPTDSDERINIRFCLSLNEYNMIANSIDVGADIAYGFDSVSVNWIWLRNMIEGIAQMCGCDATPTPSFNDRLVSQTYITNTTTNYTDTYNTWNTAGQTVASIAPDLDYDTGDPIDIEKLICLAIEMLMTSIVESAKANKSGTEAQNRDMVRNLTSVFGALGVSGGAALGVGGAAAAVVGFLGGPYLILGLALSAVGLAFANLIWITDLSVFNDLQAINDVKCTIINNLSGNSVTRDNFIGALSGGGFAPDSNAQKLANITQQYLYSLDVYLQFMVTAQGLYEVVDFGVMPDCPCIPPADCEDMTASEQGYAPMLSGRAVYHSGEGWGRGTVNASYLWITKEITGQTITSVKLTLNRLMETGTDYNVSIYPFDDTGQAFEYAISTDNELEYLFEGLSATDGLAIYVSSGALLPADLRLIEVCYTFE